MVDINNDGLLDIYVSVLGNYNGYFGTNLLYVNQGVDEFGVPSFEDKAKEYGLDIVSLSTQVAFLDYDLDGDLDLFQLNHKGNKTNTFLLKRQLEEEKNALIGDKLLRNDGGHFVNASEEAGIHTHFVGFGMGVTVSDFNDDGYPDIYVGNDLHEDDYLYINQGDGTFTDERNQWIKHTSRYVRGADVGDLNNDGLPDILTVDRMPSTHSRQKQFYSEDPYNLYASKISFGYGYQYPRNTFQINNGNQTFSEVAVLSGLSATDWSSSPLIADFNLDGRQDVFISNGVVRRNDHLDFLEYLRKNREIAGFLRGAKSDTDLKTIERIPHAKRRDFLFENTGDLRFVDQSEDWGINEETYGSGAAYGDLDNDGDLDLIVNNLEGVPSVYRNLTVDKKKTQAIRLKLKGPSTNVEGIGSVVWFQFEGGQVHRQEVYRTRGFQSSSSPAIYFGIPDSSKLSQIVVRWPDLKMQRIEKPALEGEIVLDHQEADLFFEKKELRPQLVGDPYDSTLFKHEENLSFVEFYREILIPAMQSTHGPALATGDVDNNGLEDLFIGGAKGQTPALFFQYPEGFQYIENEDLQSQKLNEDVKAEFIDVDNDEDLDLVILPGGNEFSKGGPMMEPHLYINNAGKLKRKEGAFDEIAITGGALAFNDYNGDGYVDVFVGARTTPWQYGVFPNSYFFLNDQKGNFKLDVSMAEISKELGMVKEARWGDLDGNGYDDLIIAGDWFPLTVFYNSPKGFRKVEVDKSNGFWNTLELVDVDGDGDIDVLAGNEGENTTLKATKDHPMKLYINDYDQNGKLDHLLYTFREGEDLLVATKDELDSQFVQLRVKFPDYQSFAEAKPSEIFPEEWRKNGVRREVFELRSCLWLNNGSGEFQRMPLPVEAQYSTINAIVMEDLNGDNLPDLITGGNFFQNNVFIGQQDGSYGNVLLNKGHGEFENWPNAENGLKLQGFVRDLQFMEIKGDKVLVVANNNGPLEFIPILN